MQTTAEEEHLVLSGNVSSNRWTRKAVESRSRHILTLVSHIFAKTEANKMQKNFQRNTKFIGVVLCLVGNEKVKDEQAEGTRETCRIETKRNEALSKARYR